MAIRTHDALPIYVCPNGVVTYGRLVCDIKEHKTETHQTRLTVGGNPIRTHIDRKSVV